MGRRIAFIVPIGLAVCLLVWFGGRAFLKWRQDSAAQNLVNQSALRLETARAAATDAGLIVRFSDLNKRDLTRNLADVLYESEAQIIQSDRGKNFVVNSASDKITDEYTALNPQLVTTMLRASQLERCELPYSFQDVPFVQLSSTRPFLMATRVLLSDARRAYKRGDYPRFQQSFLGADRILAQLSRQPGEKPLMTYAGEQLRLSRTLISLCNSETRPTAVQAIKKVIVSMKQPPNMLPIMHLESAKTIEACDVLYALTDAQVNELNAYGSNYDYTPPRGPKMLDAMRSRTLEFWLEAYQLAQENPDPMDVGIKVDRLLIDIAKKGEDDSYYMVRTIPAMFEQHGKILKRSVDMRRVAYAAAVLAEKGKVSSSKELALPVEGYSSQPLSYAPVDGGYVLAIQPKELTDAVKVPFGLTEDPAQATLTYRKAARRA